MECRRLGHAGRAREGRLVEGAVRGLVQELLRRGLPAGAAAAGGGVRRLGGGVDEPGAGRRQPEADELRAAEIHDLRLLRGPAALPPGPPAGVHPRRAPPRRRRPPRNSRAARVVGVIDNDDEIMNLGSFFLGKYHPKDCLCGSVEGVILGSDGGEKGDPKNDTWMVPNGVSLTDVEPRLTWVTRGAFPFEWPILLEESTLGKITIYCLFIIGPFKHEELFSFI